MNQIQGVRISQLPKIIRESKILSEKELLLLTEVPDLPEKNIDIQIEALFKFEQLGLRSLENFVKYLIGAKNIEWTWQVIYILEENEGAQ